MIFEVTGADTAEALGSGDLPVLATPRMIAWMEAATVAAVAADLPGSSTSVGTAVRVRHQRPTAVGGRVEVTAEVTAGGVGEGKLTFAVTAVDADGKTVGSGEIDRAVVGREGFVPGSR